MTHDISEIFNECIDRLANGEKLETIVADYPDHAEELRDYLQLGLLVGNIQVSKDEVQHAKQDGRARLSDLLNNQQEKRVIKMPREKPKRKKKTDVHPILNWRVLGGLVATFVLMVAGLLFFLSPQIGDVPVTDFAAQSIAGDGVAACTTVYQNPTVQRRIQGDFVVNDNNQAVAVVTATPALLSTPAPELGRGADLPSAPESEIADDRALDTASDPAIVTTSVASGAYEADGEALGDLAIGGAPVDETELLFEDEEAAEDGDVASRDEYSTGEDVFEYAAEPPSASMPVRREVTQPLQAGEINDNAEWDAYMTYRNNYLATNGTRTIANLDVSERQIIRVEDAQGLPVQGACVQIYNGQLLVHESITYATGLTMFFPNLSESTRYVDEFRVEVSAGNTTVGSRIDRDAVGSDVTTVVIDGAAQPATKLDIVFLLDATGSMSDEIRQLQDNILAISGQLDEGYGNVDIRYGLVHYRDQSDAYVAAFEDFTGDVQLFQSELNRVVAGGGGDTPEELDTGLNRALNSLSWRTEGDTIKLVFLVADAPPHFERYPDYNYSHMSQDALARGVKIHTLASSGLEPDGEYILRQIAQITMGNFIFLTYDGGTPGTVGEERPDLEVGDPEDEQGVGNYSVEQLDELVLRLITDELEAGR